ncbi:SLC41A family transporter [Microbacterium abyssi]|uniref:SLC41A family transporter n=1 Tax=Microbacterium abyssi TaxID=2782166 RepID=UPI0018878B7D|nr:magnesium transporter [Microbacterium sp. A18JL241]
MNEIQGPTPAGTSRPYRTLAEALRAHRIDPANHAFITAIVDAVGITSLIDRGRYIEAIRRGEGAPLHIGRTYTNGFTEDELIVVGSAPLRLQPSEGRAPYFYAVHPSEFLPVATSSKKTSRTPRTSSVSAPRAPKSTPVAERDYGVCDVCFMVRNAAGRCNCD